MSLTSRLQLAFLALVATSSALPLVAQPTTKSQNDPRPSAQAARRTGSLVVDGKIDESAWSAATPIGELTQSVPNEGKPASEKTEIRILYDDAAIYVGARMFDSMGPNGVRSALARRDVIMNGGSSLTSDNIALVFDTFRNKNDRTWFELNPAGVKGDHQNGDSSFDPVWEGATNIDSLGWTAEFRIPLFAAAVFRAIRLQSWGMQVWRNIDRLNEADMWAFWRSNEFGGPAYFGTLNGIVVTSRPRQMEIVPYVDLARKNGASAVRTIRSTPTARPISARAVM